MENKFFSPYDLRGKEYWEVSFIRFNLGYCQTIETIPVAFESVAEDIADILRANGYKEVKIEYHDKDLPF